MKYILNLGNIGGLGSNHHLKFYVGNLSLILSEIKYGPSIGQCTFGLVGILGSNGYLNPCHGLLSLIFGETNLLLGNAIGFIGDLGSNGHLNPFWWFSSLGFL